MSPDGHVVALITSHSIVTQHRVYFHVLCVVGKEEKHKVCALIRLHGLVCLECRARAT